MWFCSQLGAREHYAIPRALHRAGALGRLITESWLPASSLVRAIARSTKSAISNRFHNELSDARVTAFTVSSIAFELLSRARGLRGWAKIIARNRWFQRKATSALADLRPPISDSPILF